MSRLLRMLQSRSWWNAGSGSQRGLLTGRNRFRSLEGDGGDDDGSGGGGGSGGGSGGGGGDEPPGGGGNAGGGSGGGGRIKTFTQEEVNSIVAKEKNAFRTKLQEQLDRVNTLAEEKNLSEQARSALAEQKTELEASLMTAQQKAEAEKKAAETKFQGELDKAQQDSKAWRSRFEVQMKDTAILAAAGKHAAYNPTQLLGLVSPLTTVEEIKDSDGNATGKFGTVVKTAIMEKGKDGKEALTEKALSVDDYVGYLKGRKEYQNLFLSSRPGGTGHKQGSGGGKAGEGMDGVSKISAGLASGQAKPAAQ